MPTIIDALVVTLTLDTSGFTKGQKDAGDAAKKAGDESEAAAKKTEASGKKAADSLENLAKKALLVFGIFTAGKGVKDFISDLTTTDAALGRTAKNMDTSVKALSTFQGMADVVGGSAEGITQSFNGLVGQLEQFSLTGQSSVIPVFRALGINVADAQGHMRSMTDIMADLNIKFSSMDPARATAIGHMLGFDTGTINLLEMAPDKYRRLYEEQQKFAANDTDIKAAQERQSAWRDLMIISESLGRTILTSLSPAIVGVLEGIRDWAAANREWIASEITEKVKEFIRWVEGIDWTEVKKGFDDFKEKVIAVAIALKDIVRAVDWGKLKDEITNVWKEFDAWSERVLGQSGVKTAMEAFALYMAGSWVTRILGVFTKVSSGWLAMLVRMGFSSTAALLGALSAGFLAATTSPLNEGEPQIDKDGNLHFPDGHVEAGHVWNGQQGGAHLYNRRAGANAVPGARDVPGAMRQRGLDAMNYLVDKKGWTPEAAAIAVGNAQQESGIRSDGGVGDPNTPGGSHYMFQWNNGKNNDTVNGRRARYERFARDRGKSPTDFYTSLDFMDEERKRMPGLENWHKQGDLTHAGTISHLYEGFGDNSTGTRIQNSANWLRAYRGQRGASLPSGAMYWGKDANGNSVPMDAQGHPVPAPPQHQSYMNLPSPGELQARIASIRNDNSRSTSYSSEAHIQAINIHTQAADAQGIADTIGPALKRNGLVAPANYGFA